jgi:hypothetical protein
MLLMTNSRQRSIPRMDRRNPEASRFPLSAYGNLLQSPARAWEWSSAMIANAVGTTALTVQAPMASRSWTN